MHRAISWVILGATMLCMPAHGTDVKNALNGQEIKQLVSGNTVEGHFVKPREDKEFLTTSVRFRAYFSPGGDVIEKSSAGIPMISTPFSSSVYRMFSVISKKSRGAS